jgi:DNA-binding LacI/PurR family transcriptional regulator
MEERVLAAFRDPIRIAVLDGIAQETTADGRGLLLLTDVGESALAMESASMDGVILLGCSTRSGRAIDIQRRRGIPGVALGGPVFPGVLTISLDDDTASGVAARHLADLGHTTVAIVALPLDGSDTERGALTAERELAGNVQVTLDRLRGVRTVFPDSAGVVTAGSYVEEGIIAGHALLGDPGHRPTAILAQSDLLAAGVIKAAEELGMEVPRDLSVVGFDGIALDRIVPHDLTTMVQPAAEQGRAAGRAVLDLLEGGHPQSIRFASTFHLGATTGPPRRS